MSSREIAELTGKEHKHVMRDIRNMLQEIHEASLSPDLGLVKKDDEYHRGDRTQYKYLNDKTQNAFIDFMSGDDGISKYQSTYKDSTGRTQTMSSREIAELTGKEHRNVCRDVRNMLDTLNLDALSFEHIYFDGSNREQIEYHLPKDLTLTLISGYDIALRYRVVIPRDRGVDW